MGIIVAMPMVKKIKKIDLKEYEKHLRALTEVTLINPPKLEKDVISFDFDQCGVSIVPVNKAIPWSELKAPCESNMFWEEASEVVPTHKGHFICTIVGSLEEKTLAFYLTKAIEALLHCDNFIAVYWGDGNVVSSAEMFLDMSEDSSLDYLPLYLWLNFCLKLEKDNKFTVFTIGMDRLGFMDIEMFNIADDPDSAVGLAFNTAHYLLDNGPVLMDGDTFGLSEDQKLLVKHEKSTFHPNTTVYTLR